MEAIGGLKEEFPDKYLFAEDLSGKAITLTIGAINKDMLVTSKGKKAASSSPLWARKSCSS